MPDMNSDLCYDIAVGLICDFSFAKLPFGSFIIKFL